MPATCRSLGGGQLIRLVDCSFWQHDPVLQRWGGRDEGDCDFRLLQTSRFVQIFRLGETKSSVDSRRYRKQRSPAFRKDWILIRNPG
jgi:hypothetical protein